MLRSFKKSGMRTVPIISTLFIALFITGIWMLGHSGAATSGQTTLYLKKEPSDINATYNALSLSSGDTRSDTASATTSSTNVNASPPTSFCESSNNTGETFTQVSASATSTGERCIGTFISLPVGKVFTMSTGDSASISANIYSSESTSQVTSAPRIYIYRWSGSGTTVSTSDLIASWTTCADPGTSPTVCAVAQTAVSPANNITFAATDRILVIISQNVTRARTGGFVSNYFDNSSRNPSASIEFGYDLSTPNRPGLSGSLDDDFLTSQASTTCSGTSYNTKWTCPAPSAANSSADINSASMTPTGGDSSSWLTLRNQCASCTVSNFGTTPSNAFMYQPMPIPYGDGTIRTVVNSALSYQIGATTPSSPYNHVGLVLWTSNTDYLEVQLYSTGVKSSTNTVQVALNNSGTLSGATNINTSTTLGTYGLIWLGFSNTGGSWQAQYSTNGSTWNNIGTAVSHTAFTRVGLNSFAAVSGANYSGAFEWFQSTLATGTFNQTNYQWLTNADSTIPGAKLTASQSTAYTLASAGQQIRLRQLIKATGQVAASGQSFNEQVAALSSFGSCSSIPESNWIGMTSGSQNLTKTSGTVVNDGTGSAWTNLTNIGTQDSAVASVSIPTGGATQKVKANNFGFNIPSSATINGISVAVVVSSTSGIASQSIVLLKGAGFSVGSKGSVNSPSSLTLQTFGASNDLWSDTWTPADINSSNFGAYYSMANSGGSTITGNIDYLAITVYYTYSSGGIFYFNNATPASGATISANAGDPTDAGQTVQPETYQEADNFTGPTAYGNTVDAEWDLSLYDNGAPSGTTYCFRTVKSDGTPLDTYTNYPMITTWAPGPTMDQAMRGGNWFNASGVEQSFYWAQ